MDVTDPGPGILPTPDMAPFVAMAQPVSGPPVPTKSMLVTTVDQCREVCRQIISGHECPTWPKTPLRPPQRLPDQPPAKMIAVDLEGINMSRTGQVSLVTVATGRTVYVFDIVELGKEAFLNGLQAVLHAQHILKLLFDCRTDVDALKYQFNVDVEPVCDLQVTCMIHCLPAHKRNHLLGMKKAFERMNIFDRESCELKERVAKQTFESSGGDPKLWVQRPLLEDLFAYSVADVKFFFVAFMKTLQFAQDGYTAGSARRNTTIASQEPMVRTHLTDFLDFLSPQNRPTEQSTWGQHRRENQIGQHRKKAPRDKMGKVSVVANQPKASDLL